MRSFATVNEAGPAPTQAMRFSVLALRRFGKQMADVALQIRRNSFQAANRDRLSVHAFAAGTPVRTAGRKCVPGWRETRWTAGSTCKTPCNGLERSAGYTPAHSCGQGKPTGNLQRGGSSSGFGRRLAARDPETCALFYPMSQVAQARKHPRKTSRSER